MTFYRLISVNGRLYEILVVERFVVRINCGDLTMKLRVMGKVN